jgi:Ca2+-binding RTX toxin-like protein
MCTRHGPNVRVTLGSGDSATIVRSGDAIDVNGAACGGATVSNTDRITVTGASGNETVVIDLSGGQFAPGATPEANGTSEIEFSVNLLTGSGDKLRVVGGSGADNIVLGTLGVNLNGDDDADVTPLGVEVFRVAAGGGGDTVSGQGGAGTGQPVATGLGIGGGTGADTLLGGAGNDTIQGGAGPDKIRGVGGNDRLSGGGGDDIIRGGSGDDVQRGRLGRDGLIGGPGKDKLYGGDQADHLNSKDGISGNDTDNGGSGADTCKADPGDTRISC